MDCASYSLELQSFRPRYALLVLLLTRSYTSPFLSVGILRYIHCPVWTTLGVDVALTLFWKVKDSSVAEPWCLIFEDWVLHNLDTVHGETKVIKLSATPHGFMATILTRDDV